jgi:two-component system, sensor histidine kinase and response regulator
MQKIPEKKFDRIAFAEASFVKIMNLVCLISAILALLSAYIGRDVPAYTISLLSLAGIFIVSLLFNLNSKISVTRYFVPLATTAWIVYMCIAFGSELGTQNYLVIALVALAIFAKNKTYSATSITVIVIMAVFVNMHQRHQAPVFPLPAAADFLFGVNVFMPLLIISLICWNVLRDSAKSQAIIEQQKQELTDSNHFKDKVLSIIGHDMRSPFISAKGLIQLLENELISREEKGSIIKELNADIDLSLQTLDNILSWASQAYYGAIVHTKANKEPLDIYALVQNTISSFSYLARQKDIELVNLAPPSSLFLGDREQISFVLRNLTSNALKFSHMGHCITYDALEDNDKLIISVNDQGGGMTKDMLSSLFQISTRFSKEGTAKEKGSGLGLIFCKEFIANNGGELWIESKPEQGTTVYFSLLRNQPPRSAQFYS